MRVLVVDDSRAMRTILSTQLRQLGHTTVEATNGHEALAALAATPDIQLVFVDWNMPVMNGLEFVKKVRTLRTGLELPVVMVTTETETSHMIAALSAGANEYIMKPFTLDVVRSKLELVLQPSGGGA